MKFFPIVLLSLLTVKIVVAQNELAVPFVAYWNVGDSKNYRVTKKSIKTINGAEEVNEITAYEMKCTVVDSTIDSYTLEWEYQNTIMSSLKIPQEFQKSLEKYNLVKIIYTTDEVGVFKEILNWEEFRDMTMEMFNKLVELNQNDNNKNFVKAMEPLKNLFSSKESISSFILKEIQVFHFPLGVEFNALDTLRYEEQLPNLMGGAPVKGNGMVYFENVNMEEGTARFINRLELDENDSKRVVTDLVKKITGSVKFNSKKEKQKAMQEINEKFSTMKMDIQDYNTFSYYFNPGWPIHIHTKRTSSFSNQNETGLRIDEIIIEEIE